MERKSRVSSEMVLVIICKHIYKIYKIHLLFGLKLDDSQSFFQKGENVLIRVRGRVGKMYNG